MTTTSAASRFDEVLVAEQLTDLRSAFGDPNFCDEVPLYSRYEQIAFLKETGDVDAALIELALDYLDRVTTELPLGDGGWVALSVTQDESGEPIVPAAFVCHQRAEEQLAGLRLVAPPATGFGQYVRGLVRAARDASCAYSVLEDAETVPGEIRVFISQYMPPLPVLMR